MSKKIINLILFAITLTFITACSSKKEEAIFAPQGMNVLDLNKFGKPFAIFIPDTISQKLTITEQSSGALDITVGANFAITIYEQATNIDLKKTDIKNDEVNKFKTFIIEEPNALFWESEIIKPEFHFLINHKIQNKEYSIEDLKSTELEPFSKEATEKMFDSAKGIKEIKKEIA
jgi:hypothetical protein